MHVIRAGGECNTCTCHCTQQLVVLLTAQLPMPAKWLWQQLGPRVPWLRAAGRSSSSLGAPLCKGLHALILLAVSLVCKKTAACSQLPSLAPVLEEP